MVNAMRLLVLGVAHSTWNCTDVCNSYPAGSHVFLDCCSDADCSNSTQGFNGRCVAETDPCFVGPPPPPTNMCAFDECRTSQVHLQQQHLFVHLHMRYVARLCLLAQDCSGGNICQGGNCIPKNCSSDVECTAGIGGTCALWYNGSIGVVGCNNPVAGYFCGYDSDPCIPNTRPCPTRSDTCVLTGSPGKAACVPPSPAPPTPPPLPPSPTPAPAPGNYCDPSHCCSVCKACCSRSIAAGDCDECVKDKCPPALALPFL